jgi:hypothetical protein
MCMKAEAFLSVRSTETKRLARRVLYERTVSANPSLGVGKKLDSLGDLEHHRSERLGVGEDDVLELVVVALD